ncbi:hypothetical protein ESCO_001905 [Escovopsis weberi]|uniref:DUF4185 domain-containing protein n=1 Tax=Escovopsis weberi TaxID=150374 RepID=A0A0M8N766_ESCWE|nr:hypothetical protein ESCO_001905 [Escovopsis weberi]
MGLKQLIQKLSKPKSTPASSPWDGTDNTQPAGENPIGKFSVQYLGEQRSSNSASRRDLGFAGQIGGRWYAVYGDTLWCASGVSDPDRDAAGFHGMVRNSVSALTDDPLLVHDLHLNDDVPVPHQKQFTPFREEWGETNLFGFGGTGIVETDRESATGAVYYLINDHEDYRHAGVARVRVIDGAPTVTERLGDQGWWWDCSATAKYGDVAVYRDVHSDFIYIWGSPPKHVTAWPQNMYVYQARVRASDAFELEKYEYWWGRERGWRREVLAEHNSDTAVMWGVGQGQVVYSNYFGCYLYVHLNGPSVALRTAPTPGGPWSADREIFTATSIDGGFVYAGVAYPYLDESGRTLTIGYTNNNHIQVIKVTFE